MIVEQYKILINKMLLRFMDAVYTAHPENFKHLEYFHKYIYKVDFKISGGSLNCQIIIRYFKYFYKKHFLF